MTSKNPMLLPKLEAFTATPITKGFASTVFHIKTESDLQFIYRQTDGSTKKSFEKEIKISKIVAKLNLGPAVCHHSCKLRAMLLEYIPNKPWPKYSEDKKPFHAAIQALRQIHDKIPTTEYKMQSYEPFASVKRVFRCISNSNQIPNKLITIIKKVKIIGQQLKPWLNQNAVMLHGDLHPGNILVGKKISFIDWTSAKIGHPFYDLVKFSIKLKAKERLSLLNTYLQKEASSLEIKHFHLINLVYLVSFATYCFRTAIKSKEDVYTKEELKNLLKTPLPTFASINFFDRGAKNLQYGALCALKEFEENAFELKELVKSNGSLNVDTF
jgi:thiamine kinase-like enzyme